MSERNSTRSCSAPGAAGRGLRRPPRRRRPAGRDRRAPPGRRRMLLLRLHALEGAAAPRRAARRGAAGARASPQAVDRRARPRRRSLARRDEVIHDLDDSGQLPWLEERGIELFRGAGRLDGERRVVGRRRRPDRDAGRWSSPPAAAPRCRRSTASTRSGPGTTATRRPPKRVPESMVVLGGGPVGTRARPGLVDARDRGDPGRGRRAAAPARGALRRRAGRRRRCASATASTCAPAPRPSGSRAGGGGVVVELERRRAGRGGRAPGRGRPHAPHRRRSASTSVGVEPGEHGFLETDDRLRVGGREWLYAVGDVNGRALFTHMGKYQAWVAAENVLGRRGRGDRRRDRLAARHLHRPPGRRGRQDARRRPRRRASTPARSTSAPTARPAPASRARAPAAPPASSSTEASGTIVGATFTRLRDRRLPPRRDDRDRRRGAARAPAPRGRRLPDPQRDLAEAARGTTADSLDGSSGVFRSVEHDPAGSRGPDRGRRPTGSCRAARDGRAGGSPG